MIRALAAFVGIAACQSPPTTADHAAAIVGGTLDPADDAVVALTARTHPCGEAPQAACTGALIASRAVLTAAHCVTGETPATLVVTIGPRVDGGERVEIDAIEIDPDYDGVAADLAVLSLAVPLAAPPLSVRRAPIDAAEVGGAVRVVGFGVAEDGLDSSKRQGTARIAEVTDATIVLAPGPALPCSADSGGPVLLGDEIAGVVSYGDPACAVSGTSTRTDVRVESFIAPVLARIAASAPASRPPLGVEAPACTACERAVDCPRGTDCLAGVCAVSLELGALGATCTSEQTCGGTPCVEGIDDAACRCLTPCDDSADGCGCQTGSAPGDALLVVMIAAHFARRRAVQSRRRRIGAELRVGIRR